MVSETGLGGFTINVDWVDRVSEKIGLDTWYLAHLVGSLAVIYHSELKQDS